MFEFFLPGFPITTLDIAQSKISMQLHVPPREGRIALWVDISASAVELVADAAELVDEDDAEESYRIAPTFHTEWLEMPLDALNGHGADLLDGYHLVYDETGAGAEDDDQRPGAIYQDSGAGFIRVDMTLSHMGGQDYRVVASD